MVGKCHKNNTNRRKVSVESRNKGGIWECTLGRQRVGCVHVAQSGFQLELLVVWRVQGGATRERVFPWEEEP